MNIYKCIPLIVFSLATMQVFSQKRPHIVPLGGNAFGSGINDEGITGWADTHVHYDVFVRSRQKGQLRLSIHVAVPDGRSTISITVSGAKGEKKLQVSGSEAHDYDAGSWMISDTGYHSIRIAGLHKTGKYFGDIDHVTVDDSGAGEGLAFVRNNEGNFFHWGRRGPSVHLNYSLPQHIQTEYFYNEVTVPVGDDIEGSYFMADGFGQGYFGMQVNSPTERHILFSVWSPFSTDDPAAIPDSLRIRLVRKGVDVHAGEFGNEGSGGQSYCNYMWRAGNTYRFLLRATPVDSGYTQFTAWFYAPEEGKWRLIASFKRPKTQSWLTNLHSFLENFEPTRGDKQRSVVFSHPWIRDISGKWISLRRARFTGDNTARKGYRMDYGGGVKGNVFYLTNGGFFSDYTALDQLFELAPDAGVSEPAIELNALP